MEIELGNVYHKNGKDECVIPNSEQAKSKKKNLIKNKKRHFKLTLTLNEKKIKAEYK